MGHDLSSPGAPGAGYVPSPSQRARDVATLGLFALGAGLSWQLLFVPFYVRNAIGYTVPVPARVQRSAGRGGAVYTVVAKYTDRSGRAQTVRDDASRWLYERCGSGECAFKFVVVEGWPWLAQLGALPEISPWTAAVGALFWIGLLLALRDEAVARSLLDTAWRGRVSASAVSIGAAGSVRTSG